MKKMFIVLATVFATQSVFAQLYFGTVRVNSMNNQTTYITNNTNTDLLYSNHFVSGMYFYANHNCYGILRPHQSCMFQVQYWPGFPGYHSAYIYMTFNNPVTHQSFTKTLNAWGQAVPY
jgi:hypothetical protein